MTQRNEESLTRAIMDLNTPLNPADFLQRPDGTLNTARRVTESYNANDAYYCPNGHIQYNLTPEALADCKAREVIPPPICYEGSRCISCEEAITQLSSDPQNLQFKLSRAMMHNSKLQFQVKALLDINSEMNRIVEFVRAAYSFEIAMGERQHGRISDAVIYYLQRERRRPSVIASKLWQAFLRLFGI